MYNKTMKPLIPSLILMLLLTACADNATQPAAPAGATPAALTVTSPAFQPGQPIPSQYTCQGDDSSPALQWTNPPAGTKSLALIMDDPDAPVGTWVHWVVYNIPTDAGGLAEGASKANASEFQLPQGTVQGRTSFNRSDYGGPCPPSGSHRYFFRLFALDVATLALPPRFSAGEVLRAMQGHVLAEATLHGTYTLNPGLRG